MRYEIIFRHLSKYINVNKIFKALNDQTRREILEALRKKDMTAGDIAELFHISKPSISHHLDILKQASLVIDERQGQFIIYSLNMTVMDDIYSWLIQFQSKNKTNGKGKK